MLCKSDNMAQTNKSEKSARFGEDFFDSGKRVPGAFSYYSFDEYVAVFRQLCGIIVKTFNPTRVLDVGCAKGSLVCAFRDLGISAYGVDVSEYAIASAPGCLRQHLYVVDMDRDSLPFKDGLFDFVTFLGSIEYLRNTRHVIAELERVMVDRGSLLLTTIYRRPKGDAYRFNIHTKSTWLKEFGPSWGSSPIYNTFMSSYLRNVSSSKPFLDRVKKLLFGKSKISDRFFCFLYDLCVKLHFLNYGVILLTLRKKEQKSRHFLRVLSRGAI